MTDPIGCCHLYYDLDGGGVEVAPVSSHYHGGALAVSQVDGGEDTLDEVLQIVPFALENTDILPEAAGAGPLVRIRNGVEMQHL